MAEFTLSAGLFLGFIVIQRLGELVLAKRNTARLLQRGAREFGAGHYPVIVALHTGWIIALFVFGAGNEVSLPWLAGFVVLQAARLWILASLGDRWTTRIIVLNEPLVTSGPFAFLRHPNYVLVAGEIIVAPMVLGLPIVAVVFTLLNGAVLALRINVEEKALASLRNR